MEIKHFVELETGQIKTSQQVCAALGTKGLDLHDPALSGAYAAVDVDDSRVDLPLSRPSEMKRRLLDALEDAEADLAELREIVGGME